MRSIDIHNMVMHDLRSMVGVVSLRNGADIFSVSKMLSHTNLSTTQRSYLTDGSELALGAQTTIYGYKKCSRKMDNANKKLELNSVSTSHPL